MDLENLDKTRLVTEIQEVLSTWTKANPDLRTVAYLSRETGVSDSAIRRLMNSDVKIVDDSLFKILTHVAGVYEYRAFLEYFSEKNEILKWFVLNYSYLKKSPAVQDYKPTSTAEVVSENTIALSVYGTVSSVKNVTDKLIKERFGAIGEYELDKLIQREVISVTPNGTLVAKDGKLKLTKEQVIKNIPELTKLFLKKDHTYNGRILNIESVSLEGYVKIMDAFDRFINDVTSIAKENEGEIPVITAGFMDTLTTIPYFEGGKNEISN